MIGSLHPALIFVLGGLLAMFLRGRARSVTMLAIPVVGLINLLALPLGQHMQLAFLDQTLTLLRVDKLSLLFGVLFHIGSFLGILYALHVKDTVQQVSAPVYVAGALGAVFAGDLLTLLLSWEVLAVSSVFLIWARREKDSFGIGLRYLIPQLGSGVLLMVGIALHVGGGGSIAFDKMQLGNLATLCIFLGFGIKCAFPGFHTWLVEGYPGSTVTGGVFLCGVTTKVAVYAMARGFAGTEALIAIGAVMAVFPIFYAVIENDLRKVLGYSMINQIGFMMVGIGIGSEMGINGAVAHAFNDVFFKGLLFMSMGAVMLRTGTMNASDLGGLSKSMPWTAGFCCVGAASISAFPLFCGFVSKSMIMVAAADAHYTLVWFLLLFAAAGVFHHAGIKIPFFAFWAHDQGLRVKEAPRNMLLAMGGATIMCVGIGCFPMFLYGNLPFPVDYHPYTAFHIVSQLQLLFFAALAFTTLQLTGIYPPELRSINLDIDWFFRRSARGIAAFVTGPATRARAAWNARSWDLWVHNPLKHPSVAAFIRRVQFRPLETSVFVVITLLFMFLAFGLIT